MSEMNLTPKRKRTTIDTQDEILKKLKSGFSPRQLTEEYGISKSGVYAIKKRQKTIEDFKNKNPLIADRKSVRSPKYAELDEALKIWFFQMRSRNVPLSGPIVREKALALNLMLKGDANFKATDGFLYRFLNRYRLRELNPHGDKGSADKDAIAPYVCQLRKEIEDNGYSSDQIFNCDEAGLFWRNVPRRTLDKNGANPEALKMAKERVTILVCSNASGSHRLPIMLIHTAKKPQCFTAKEMNHLPVKYYQQKSAWMDLVLFEKWFHDEFVPSVENYLQSVHLEPKALLLIDNAPCHPDELVSYNGLIRVKCLPPNTTSIIQPMDQGVIHSLKQSYRRLTVQKIIAELESNANLTIAEAIKSIDLRHCIFTVAKIWNEMQITTLQNAWLNLNVGISSTNVKNINTLNANEIDALSHMLQTLSVDINQRDVCDWIEDDNSAPAHHYFTDDEIVQIVLTRSADQLNTTETHTMDIDNSENQSPTAIEALHHLKKLSSWFQNNDPTLQNMSMLHKMNEFVNNAIITSRNLS